MTRQDLIDLMESDAAIGIPAKRVERIYRNDLPKEDEIVSILEWVGNR